MLCTSIFTLGCRGHFNFGKLQQDLRIVKLVTRRREMVASSPIQFLSGPSGSRTRPRRSWPRRARLPHDLLQQLVLRARRRRTKPAPNDAPDQHSVHHDAVLGRQWPLSTTLPPLSPPADPPLAAKKPLPPLRESSSLSLSASPSPTSAVRTVDRTPPTAFEQALPALHGWSTAGHLHAASFSPPLPIAPTMAASNMSSAVGPQAQTTPTPPSPPTPPGPPRASSRAAELLGPPRLRSLNSCSDCLVDFTGPSFMLNDRAYCCQRHRMRAYQELERCQISDHMIEHLGFRGANSPQRLLASGVRASFRAWI